MSTYDSTRSHVDACADGNIRGRQAFLARALRRLGGDRLLVLLARLAYRLRIDGEGHIPSAGACLFAMNSEALIAEALIYLTIRRRRPDVNVFSWQNLSGESPMYDFMTRFGEKNVEARYLRVYKAKGLSAGALLRGLRVLQEGGAVCLAAAGELTWDGRLQYPLSPGTAWLGLRTGVPVVPIVTIGGYDVEPRWRRGKMRFTGRITIRVGRPFAVCEAPITRLSDEALGAANQSIWEALAALLPPGRIDRSQE